MKAHVDTHCDCLIDLPLLWSSSLVCLWWRLRSLCAVRLFPQVMETGACLCLLFYPAYTVLHKHTCTQFLNPDFCVTVWEMFYWSWTLLQWVCVCVRSDVQDKFKPFSRTNIMCVCLPGLVHRPEPNPQQTRKEEAIRRRHTDRHQSNWVRSACSVCQDQQQVDIWSLTDSLFLKTEHLVLIHTHTLTLLMQTQIIQHVASSS